MFCKFIEYVAGTQTGGVVRWLNLAHVRQAQYATAPGRLYVIVTFEDGVARAILPPDPAQWDGWGVLLWWEQHVFGGEAGISTMGFVAR